MQGSLYHLKFVGTLYDPHGQQSTRPRILQICPTTTGLGQKETQAPQAPSQLLRCSVFEKATSRDGIKDRYPYSFRVPADAVSPFCSSLGDDPRRVSGGRPRLEGFLNFIGPESWEDGMGSVAGGVRSLEPVAWLSSKRGPQLMGELRVSHSLYERVDARKSMC